MLDTNVLSEVMKPAPMRSGRVFDWLASQPGENLFTTTITVAELLSGVAILPDGKRGDEKEDGLRNVLALCRGRVLPIDLAATPHHASAITLRRKSGRSLDAFDLLVAAIARANGISVATRNTSDLEECGIDLVNPCEA